MRENPQLPSQVRHVPRSVPMRAITTAGASLSHHCRRRRKLTQPAREERRWRARSGCGGARGVARGGSGVEPASAGALFLHRGPSTTFSKKERAAHLHVPFLRKEVQHSRMRLLADESLQIGPAIWSPCLWFFWTTSMLELGTVCSSMRFAAGTPEWWRSKTSSSTTLSPHIYKVYYEKRPVVVATPPMLFSTATMFLGPTVTTDARCQMSPEQARQYTLHSLAQQVDVPEHQG